MNQSDFVSWANKQHQFIDETFEDAHFPLPKGLGEKTIRLHHLDHAIQGVFQSEEVGRKCFYNGHTKAALKAPNYFPPGWFEAWDLYDKWTTLSSTSNGRDVFERKTGCFGLSKEDREKVLEKSHQTTKKLGKGFYGPTRPIAVKITCLKTNQTQEFPTIKEASKGVKITLKRLYKALASDGIIHKKWFNNHPEFKVEKI